MDKSIFAYGTLRSPGTVRAVLGRNIESSFQPATLRGYKRYNFGIYYIVPDPKAEVKGVVVNGIEDEDFDRLDIYEGVSHNHYQRVTETAVLDDGSLIEVEVYVAGDRSPAYSYGHNDQG